MSCDLKRIPWFILVWVRAQRIRFYPFYECMLVLAYFVVMCERIIWYTESNLIYAGILVSYITFTAGFAVIICTGRLLQWTSDRLFTDPLPEVKTIAPAVAVLTMTLCQCILFVGILSRNDIKKSTAILELIPTRIDPTNLVHQCGIAVINMVYLGVYYLIWWCIAHGVANTVIIIKHWIKSVIDGCREDCMKSREVVCEKVDVE